MKDVARMERALPQEIADQWLALTLREPAPFTRGSIDFLLAHISDQDFMLVATMVAGGAIESDPAFTAHGHRRRPAAYGKPCERNSTIPLAALDDAPDRSISSDGYPVDLDARRTPLLRSRGHGNCRAPAEVFPLPCSLSLRPECSRKRVAERRDVFSYGCPIWTRCKILHLDSLISLAIDVYSATLAGEAANLSASNFHTTVPAMDKGNCNGNDRPERSFTG